MSLPQVAIAAAPELVRSGQTELSSTLTPLNCAAAQNHADCAQLLIDAGAPLEARDGFGLTPLMVSACSHPGGGVLYSPPPPGLDVMSGCFLWPMDNDVRHSYHPLEIWIVQQ